MTADELRALLRHPGCPWLRSPRELGEAVAARRKGEPLAPTGHIRLTDLVRFAREQGSDADPDEIDRLMKTDLHAKTEQQIDLDDLTRRSIRRLTGRRNPRQELYVVSPPS